MVAAMTETQRCRVSTYPWIRGRQGQHMCKETGIHGEDRNGTCHRLGTNFRATSSIPPFQLHSPGPSKALYLGRK